MERAEIILDVKTDGGMKSLRQMKQELRELQIAMSKASDPTEFKRLEAEFAQLRNDMKDTSAAMQYLDPGELLGGWIKMTQGVIGSFAAITGAMSLFGDESEQIQEIEKKSMALIQTMMGLEQARQFLIDEGGKAQIKSLLQNTALQIKQAAATAAQTIAQKGYTMATEGATVATRLLGKVMVSIPFVAIAAAIAGVVVGIANMVKNIKSANEESFRLKKYTEQLSVEFAKESAHLKVMSKAITDAKIGTQERAEAVKALNEQYKDYLPYLLDEKMSNEQIAIALQQVNEQLMQNMIIKMRTTTLEDLYTKQVQAELAIIDKQTRQQEQLKKAEDARRAGRDTEAKQYETNAKVFDDGIQVQKDALKDLDAEIAKAEAAFDKLAAKYKVATKPVPKPTTTTTTTTTPSQVDIDNLADFYGEYFKELERHNKTIANINEAFRTGQIKSQAEYDERMLFETRTHNQKIAELELNDREDLDLKLSDAAKKKLEKEKREKEEATQAAIQAAEAEAMRMEFEREKQQKIQEGWYAEEILRRENNFGKRLEMLKDFHNRGLILEEDYQRTVALLIQEQVGKYADYISTITDNLSSVFSNLTEMAMIEIEKQDYAWQQSYDERSEALNTHLEDVRRIFGEESQRYKDLLEEQKKMDEDKAEHDKKIAIEKKAAEQKYAKFQIEAQMAEATATFAQGVAGIWAQALATQGPFGVLTATALTALLTATYGTQMSLMIKQFGAVGKMRQGGLITGPSHEAGGVLKELEGGEFVLNARAMSMPGMKSLASQLNTMGNTNATTSPLVVDSASVAEAVATAIKNIPITVLESDITRTQKRVQLIQNKNTL
jgi:hypothetical protein